MIECIVNDADAMRLALSIPRQKGLIPPAAAILLQTAAALMQFTVLRAGVRRSPLRAHPRLNNLVTSLAGAFLGLVMVGAAFRHVLSSITA
jgi:hypothetical protein